ncbi:hypothetical protein JOS77_27615 [Chromobacterium haemolyticum]|nr:hypothetical protein JOS77_27615 [Chromobacterium haemolyticum]
MQNKPMDISEFIDDSPLSRYQVMVLTLCFLIVLLDGFDTPPPPSVTSRRS